MLDELNICAKLIILLVEMEGCIKKFIDETILKKKNENIVVLLFLLKV
jgi:hypothetical protein